MDSLSSIIEERKMELNELAIKHIESSAKWAKFIAIVGFVGVGFILILAVTMAFVLPSMNMSELQNMQGGSASFISGMGPLVSLLYLLMAVLYFVPTLYLFNYSRHSLRAIKDMDTELLTSAFNNMRRMFKFIGILTIILLALYAIVFFGTMMGAVLGNLL